MKYIFLWIIPLTILFGCQHHDTLRGTEVFITQGKLQRLASAGGCGNQLAIVLEDGEKLQPTNMNDLEPLPEEDTDIQVAYVEVPATRTDSCTVGKLIRISHIDKITP